MNKLVTFILVLALAMFAVSAQAQFGARAGSQADASIPAPDGAGTDEGFDDITTLAGDGWLQQNNSNPLGSTNWFQGNDGVFPAHAGATTAYIAANFNNAGVSPGYVCNWLVLPDLGSLSSLTFFTRTVTGNTFPDRLRVLRSPSGGTSTGNCSGGFGDFTEELLVINGSLSQGVYPQSWTEFTVIPGGAGRVAFVYDVQGGGPLGNNSNFIGIDTVSWEAGAPDIAAFRVSKDFNDNNPSDVTVTLSCNTGLPLEQTTTISEGEDKNILVRDFEQGALNCTVTEVPVEGYTPSYYNGDSTSSTNCAYSQITGGQYECEITNTLQSSTVDVSKVWIDENPGFNPVNYAEAEWYCSPIAFCDVVGAEGHCDDDGSLSFLGNPGADSFYVYPNWDGGTTCWVSEVSIDDGGVETDDSECQGITLFPGDDASCTIYNTRLYEGIPTLSQYGLAVLALLMLGMGMIGFRRFV